MPQNLPNSWPFTSPGKGFLSNYAPNGIVGGGSQDFFFAEKADNVSPNDARISANQNSAAVMVFYMKYDDWVFQPSLKIISETILGGYSTANNKKNAPIPHPYFPGMFAKDIVSIKPMYIDRDGDTQPGNHTVQGYNLAEVTISFESLPYYVNKDYSLGDPYNPNWLETRSRASNQRITLPIGFWTFQTGGYASPPQTLPWVSEYGNFVVQGLKFIQIIVHRVPESELFVTGTTKCKFDDFMGQINDADFMSYKKGCLLMDSAELEPYGSWLNESKVYDVKYNILYTQTGGPVQGWNTAPDPAGDWNSIAFALSGGMKVPFQSCNFGNTFFVSINP